MLVVAVKVLTSPGLRFAVTTSEAMDACATTTVKTCDAFAPSWQSVASIPKETEVPGYGIPETEPLAASNARPASNSCASVAPVSA